MKVFDIIKYEGPNDVYAVRHEATDFNTGAQLIVHESQEAVFFADGQALDLFSAGSYTLNTKSLPLLSKLIRKLADDQSPFHSEVYFVNRTVPLDMKWGTSSQIEVFDPRFNIILHAGAHGQSAVQIEDSRKFLVKLVGTAPRFDRKDMENALGEIITTRVKNDLATILNYVSFVEVQSHLNELSEALQTRLREELREYGLLLGKFLISDIHVPSTDYQQLQRVLAEASVTRIQGETEIELERHRMEALGYSYGERRRYDVLDRLASRPAASGGGVGGTMAELPIDVAIGKLLAGQLEPLLGGKAAAAPAAAPAETPPEPPSPGVKRFCSGCGKKLEADARFCPSCGKKVAVDPNTCPGCGRTFQADESFCPACGTKKEEP